MAEAGDIIDTIQKGAGMAGKAAARAVGEISRGLIARKESPGSHPGSGVYYRFTGPDLSRCLLPSLDFHEPQEGSSVSIGFLKSLTIQGGERAFIGGLRALMQGRGAEAMSGMREAAARDPQMADAYFVLGALLGGENRFVEAAEVLEKALLCQGALGQRLGKYLSGFRLTLPFSGNSAFLFFPDLPGTSLLLALFRRAAGKREEAVRGLEQLMSVLPGNTAVLFFLGCLDWEGGRYERLRDRYSSREWTGTGGAACTVLLGKSLTFLGDQAAAVQVLRKSLQLEDLDPWIEADIRLALAEALSALGNGAEASQEAARVSAWKPGFEELTRRLGLSGPGGETPVPEKSIAPGPASTLKADELFLCSGDGKVNVPLTGCRELVVGREEGDLVLSSDEALSRRHFRVFSEEGRLWLEDLHSTNGTLVNGYQISARAELHRGDRIKAGGTLLEVR
jgi:tetratricopeptide (TPR) repeat protein